MIRYDEVVEPFYVVLDVSSAPGTFAEFARTHRKRVGSERSFLAGAVSLHVGDELYRGEVENRKATSP